MSRVALLCSSVLVALGGCVSVDSSPAPALSPSARPSDAPAQSPPASVAPVAPTGPSTPGIPGAVIFSDDFSGSTRFLTSGEEPSYGGSEYVDGVYRMYAKTREYLMNYAIGSSIDDCSGVDCSAPDTIHAGLQTALVDVDAIHREGAASGSFGIACAYHGSGRDRSFVGLTISSDGTRHAIALNRVDQAQDFGSTPFDFVLGGADRADPHPAIKRGPGQKNHLRAECGRQTFRLSVNDVVVATGELREPLRVDGAGPGIGLLAASGPDGRMDVDFDNLVVSELIQEPPVPNLAGSVMFSDPLNVPSRVWFTGSQQESEMSFAEMYRVTMPELGGSASLVPQSMFPPLDVSVRVDVTFVEGIGLGWAGLECRNSNTGAYVFAITPEGLYWIYRFSPESEEPTVLVNFELNDAIIPGLGRANRIRFDCVGDTLTGFVNGIQITHVTDATVTDPGYGLQVVSIGPLVVDYANFQASYVDSD